MRNRTLSRYGVMGVFSAFNGALGAGEDGGTPVQSWELQPTPEAAGVVDPVTGIPYYLEKPDAVTGQNWEFQPGWEPPPEPAAVDPVTGIPYYLAKPEEPLPSWVIPVAVGAGAFVLLGGLGLVLGKKRRR
jgi:hypothetical protein